MEGNILFKLQGVIDLKKRSDYMRDMYVWVPPSIVRTEDERIEYHLPETLFSLRPDENEKKWELLRENGWKEVNVNQEKLVEDLFKLGSPGVVNSFPEMERFILEHGPLWLNPGIDMKTEVIGPQSFWTPYGPAFYWNIKDQSRWKLNERIENFRRIAEDFHNVLALSLILAVSDEVSFSQDGSSCNGIPVLFHALGGARHGNPSTKTDLQEILKKVIDSYISLDIGARWNMDWKQDGMILEMKNSWGFLWIAWYSMILLLSRSENIARCKGCGKIHFRKRAPKKGQKAYCSSCSENYRHSKTVSQTGRDPNQD